MAMFSSAAKSTADFLFGDEIFPKSAATPFTEPSGANDIGNENYINNNYNNAPNSKNNKLNYAPNSNNYNNNHIQNSNSNNNVLNSNNYNNMLENRPIENTNMNVDNNNNMNYNSNSYDYYDRDITNVIDEDETIDHLGSNPGPPYSNNILEIANKKNPAQTQSPQSAVGTVLNGDLDPGTLAYDPSSKTLYVPRHISESLSISDGSILPLPHDLLEKAVSDGQIQLVANNNNNNNMAHVNLKSASSNLNSGKVVRYDKENSALRRGRETG